MKNVSYRKTFLHKFEWNFKLGIFFLKNRYLKFIQDIWKMLRNTWQLIKGYVLACIDWFFKILFCLICILFFNGLFTASKFFWNKIFVLPLLLIFFHFNKFSSLSPNKCRLIAKCLSYYVQTPDITLRVEFLLCKNLQSPSLAYRL